MTLNLIDTELTTDLPYSYNICICLNAQILQASVLLKQNKLQYFNLEGDVCLNL